MLVIIKSIIPIFLVIFLGIITKILLRKKISSPKLFVWLGLKEENTWIGGLNGYALYIGLPALIFYGLIHTDRSQFVTPSVLVATGAILIAVLLLTTLIVKLLRLKKETANTYITAIFWGNVAYLGFPFLDSLIPGTNGTVSMLVAVHLIIAFTVLITILEYQKKGKADIIYILKQLIKNPLLIAVVVGLIWLIAKIPLPTTIDKAIGMLAASASPVILIAIGMFMARKMHFDSSFFHGIIISALKIVIMPSLFILIGLFIALPSSFNISTILAGMPAALTPFALAEIYPLNRRIIVNSIIISTVLSILTLSALSFIVL